MTSAQQSLYNEIVKLPPEKLGKAMSFVRYLVQEPEPELIFSPGEEDELHALYASDDFVDAADVFEKIMRLPDDKIS